VAGGAAAPPRGSGYDRPGLTRRPLTEARFATVREVAALLRVSRMTVYRLIRQGDLPAVRVGRGYRIREEDVDRYLEERFTAAG
jgi:excisionase family DNA binding protein